LWRLWHGRSGRLLGLRAFSRLASSRGLHEVQVVVGAFQLDGFLSPHLFAWLLRSGIGGGARPIFALTAISRLGGVLYVPCSRFPRLVCATSRYRGSLLRSPAVTWQRIVIIETIVSIMTLSRRLWRQVRPIVVIVIVIMSSSALAQRRLTEGSGLLRLLLWHMLSSGAVRSLRGRRPSGGASRRRPASCLLHWRVLSRAWTASPGRGRCSCSCNRFYLSSSSCCCMRRIR